MTELPEHLPVSHLLPPITNLPGDDRGLARFVAEQTRPRSSLPIDVPDAVCASLWCLVVGSLGVGVWLTAVVFFAAPCSGFTCTVATWGHPALLLALAAACVVAVCGVAAWSHGLTAVAPLPLGVAAVGAACGLLAVAGVAALLALVAMGLFVVGRIAATVISRV